MSGSFFVRRLHRVLGGLSPGSGPKKRRSWARRFTGLEYLEGRALMATINASGVISSTAAGANFNNTITLTNASSSNAGIGTFWFAWVPGEDFLATSPISVSPPPGWSDNITHMGPGDGFAIQFIANSPASDVQPGSSLNFSFTSADSPAAINGNSVFFPGTPVGTAFVYPQGPFSDAGHQFVVTPAPTPTPTPPVTVIGVQDVENQRHQVTQILVDLSGPVNAAQAENVATFRLAEANSQGSFTARNSPVLRLRSAVFNPANDTVTLMPRKAFTLSRPVEVTINGTAGGNTVALIRRSGVTLDPGVPAASRATRPTHHAPPVILRHTPVPVRPVIRPTPVPVAPVSMSPPPAPVAPVSMGPVPSPIPPVLGPSPFPIPPVLGPSPFPGPSGGGGSPIFY